MGAFAPGLPAFPAIAFEIVGGRGQHVGDAVNEIAPSVAIEVDRKLDVGARQELGLAELARPGAPHPSDAEVAALENSQRRHQLVLKLLGTAAVVCQRSDRTNDRLAA